MTCDSGGPSPDLTPQIDSPAPPCRLLRSRPTTVASESPHDSLPLRGKSCAFGQTDLQPSSVFTPPGQRLRAVHTHLPPAARAPSSGPSCVLTHRRPIGLVASESPHDCCFGVASRLLTPTGQKLRFWPNCLAAAGSFHPCRGNACALPARHPQLRCALFANRTSKIAHRT